MQNLLTNMQTARSSHRALIASLVGLALASAGCSRTRLLSPKGSANLKKQDAGLAGPRDAGSEGPRDLAGLRDAGSEGSRDGVADRPRDGAVEQRADLASDTRRDANGDRALDLVCAPREVCGNGIDDDCNGLADCQDPICQNEPSCINRKQEQCTNGIDDDGNGLVDCMDPACFGDLACFVLGHEVCNNNLDDDDDGLVDCKDPDCAQSPSCIVRLGEEICDNGIDDNGDALVDCSDPKCKNFAACLRAACTADVDFGAIASSGASVTRTLSTVGATASYNTCAPPGGVARVAGFSLAAAADVKLDFSQGKGGAHVVALYRAGVGQACDGNPVDCLRVDQDATASHTFTALAAGSYWLVVQSFVGTAGSTTVTLSTSQTASPEICNNGKDDDGDGAIDCADLDCASASNCHPCTADILLGAIVPGDNPRTVVVDTATGSDRYHPTCAGTSTGKDVVVQFSVKTAVGIRVELSQLSGDHVYGLYYMPSAGAACDSEESNCANLGGRSYDITDWHPRGPGEYLFIFKPVAAGKEGRLSLTISAFPNRGVEICDNGIDDDGNQLVDCDDPACADTPNCRAPLCVPDGDLGSIDIGKRKTLSIDLRDATRTFTTTCGKGDGHGRAYRFNLQQPMSLGFDCTQTGDQILQLAAQVNPLDLCDADPVNCADPSMFPGGCAFTLPTLQPGAYNLLVQAFTSGAEGTMSLTLTGLAERIPEICNNGIDDDGDGAVDCYDRKCAGEPSCAKLVCRADRALGILPLDGSLTSAALQTSNAGDDQTLSPCVSGKGGADAVVGFTLTAKADLTIAWAQFGNHALVLYQDSGASLPCEADTRIDCTATAAATSGSYKIAGLAQGNYFLVVDADKAGSEGGVVLQMSGLPSTTD